MKGHQLIHPNYRGYDVMRSDRTGTFYVTTELENNPNHGYHPHINGSFASQEAACDAIDSAIGPIRWPQIPNSEAK